MAKKLKELLKGIEYEIIQGSLEKRISGVFYDSRKCEDEGLFVAIPGLVADGHDFISQGIKNGAKTVVVNRNISVPQGITVLKTSNTRKALAIIAGHFYGNPSEKMKVVGITGTNGKTTTIHLLKSIYEQAGYKVGLIGTIGASIGDNNIPCKNTTPESLDLQKILFEMANQQVDYCFIEVSSHALGLERIYGTKIYGGMYTNLSPDHMEFHTDMEEYYNTKKKLFLMSDKHNVINIDDPYGKRLNQEIASLGKKNITYGLENKADYMAQNIEYHSFGIKYDLLGPAGKGKIEANIPGKVNAYNSLTAASFALSDNITIKNVFEGIKKVSGVKGRFETVYKDENLQVIVDFAHTEDALKEVITSLRPFTKGRIILVFGVYAAPGKQGQGKRFAMGKTAAEFADILFVTSDNPKNQNPNDIINDIVDGIRNFEKNKEFYSYIDRKEAIEMAINKAEKNDLILITGKGHETAQVIGNEEIPFHEKSIVVNAVIKNKNKAGI